MELMGNIPISILEDILDSCIVGVREGNSFQVNISYPFISSEQQHSNKDADLTSVTSDKQSEDEGTEENTIPAQTKDSKSESWPETTSILFLSQSKEHLQLLEHPVITTFLYMKWKTI